MAICLCDKDVTIMDLNEMAYDILWRYFLNENNIDNIIVVYDDNTFYGTCTYGLLLRSVGNLDKCISKDCAFISETFWNDAKEKLQGNKNMKYLPVFDDKNQLTYFCYNDEKLDVFLTELEEIQKHKEWMVLEAISKSIRAICFIDMNEVAFKFYQIALERDITISTLGEKWKAFSINTNQDVLELYPDFTVLIVNSRTSFHCQEKQDWNYVNSVAGNYNSIHQIFYLNALSVSILLDRKVMVSKNNLVRIKNEVLARLNKNNMFIKDLVCNGKTLLYSAVGKVLSGSECVEYMNLIKQTWKKKVAGLYGNCQTILISKYLLNNDEFTKQYVTLDMPRVYDLKEFPEQHWPEIIGPCFDLLIYQWVNKDNKFGEKASTDYLKTTLKSDCKLICIPNAYFSGYFPQVKCDNEEYLLKCKPSIIKERGALADVIVGYDYNIIKEYIECHDINEVIRRLSDEDYYKGREHIVTDNLKESLNELKNREKVCDIIISDYIEDNYRELKLFGEPIHSSNELLIELTNRLLRFLGYKYNKNFPVNKYNELFTRNMLIYPSVSKILGLKFNVDEYYYNRNINNQKVSLAEYIELYIRNRMEI